MLYDYGLKHYPNHMITKKAEQRLKIIKFWKQYELQAVKDAYRISRSTLFEWWKKYKKSGYILSNLNPYSQAPIKKNKRKIHPLILKKIKRLRLEVIPNMGKDKIEIFLDIFCKEYNIKSISSSTIGRIIKDKKIYHQRQKVSHFRKIKIIKKSKKLPKPKGFKVNEVGDLIEIDTIVRFDWDIKRYIITAVDICTRFSFSHVYQSHNSVSTKKFNVKLMDWLIWYNTKRPH